MTNRPLGNARLAAPHDTATLITLSRGSSPCRQPNPASLNTLPPRRGRWLRASPQSEKGSTMTDNQPSALNSQLPDRPAPADWQQRAEQFQEQQWALAQELLALGRRSLLTHLGQIKPATSLAQVEKILRLAAKLGQISSEVSAAKKAANPECPKCCAARMEWEAALEKVYGQPRPGEVTGGDATPKPGEPGSAPSTLNPQPSTN